MIGSAYGFIAHLYLTLQLKIVKLLFSLIIFTSPRSSTYDYTYIACGQDGMQSQSGEI